MIADAGHVWLRCRDDAGDTGRISFFPTFFFVAIFRIYDFFLGVVQVKL